MSQTRGKRPREEALSIPPKQYVKLLPRSRKCRGFEFTFGENTDTQPLRQDAHCGPGLHIAHFCDIHHWLRLFQPDEAIEMALVDVPDGEPLVQYTHKAKAHRIVLRAPQPVPYEVYLRGIRMNVISLDYVPNYLRTDELLDTALEARASNLAHMCTAHRTRERCERVLRRGLLEVWSHVPTALRDEAMCLTAIAANAYMVRRIAATMEVSEVVAVAAVRRDERVLQHVPPRMRTRAVINALRQPFRASVFPSVPATMQTPQMRMEAVQRNGAMLQHVAVEHQTPELCAAAVAQDGNAFRYVAPRFKTMALAIAAVERTPSAITLLPTEFLGKALWSANITHHHHEVFSRLPEAHKTPSMCMSAVQASYTSILHVPAADLSRDMCHVAWRGFKREKYKRTRSGGDLSSTLKQLLNHHTLLCAVAWELGVVDSLAEIPKKMRTQELCERALQKGTRNWRFVPKACRTEALWLIVCGQDQMRYQDLEPHDWTEALLLQALPCRTKQWLQRYCQIAPSAWTEAAAKVALSPGKGEHQWELCDIPQHARTEGVCRDAIAHGCGHLRFVPNQARSQDVCRLALTKRRGELEDVPEALRTIPMIKLASTTERTACAIPRTMWTAELAKEFAKAHTEHVLCYLPTELRTVELCMSLMPWCPKAVTYLPQPVPRATYLHAISEHHGAAAYVPRDLLEEEAFCMEVLRVSDRASSSLSEALFDAEIWHEDVVVQLAVRGIFAFDHRPCTHARFTHDMCLTILRRQGLALCCIVDVIDVSHELCLAAVCQNGLAYQYVPPHLRTTEIVEAAIQQDGMALEHVPLDQWTEALCLKAMQRSGMQSFDIMVAKGRHFPATSWFFVETYPHCMRRVPLAHITKEMCDMVLEQDIGNIHEVPRAMCTVDMATRYIAAGRSLGLCGWWDEALVVQALRRDPTLATSITYWDYELARAAAQASPSAFAHVPDDLRTASLRAVCEQMNTTTKEAS